MKHDINYDQDIVDREWRRKHPVRYALNWLGIALICAWCLYTGASAIVGFFTTPY